MNWQQQLPAPGMSACDVTVFWGPLNCDILTLQIKRKPLYHLDEFTAATVASTLIA